MYSMSPERTADLKSDIFVTSSFDCQCDYLLSGKVNSQRSIRRR